MADYRCPGSWLIVVKSRVMCPHVVVLTQLTSEEIYSMYQAICHLNNGLPAKYSLGQRYVWLSFTRIVLGSLDMLYNTRAIYNQYRQL